MKNILQTTQLEFDKSMFLIDLVEHTTGKLYIEITQNVKDDRISSQVIKINPSVLSDLMKVLQRYQTKLPQQSKPSSNYLAEADQRKILDRYLKGVSIKDLSLQFDKSEKIIEMVLRNKDIEIVPNKIPKKRYWRRRK